MVTVTPNTKITEVEVVKLEEVETLVCITLTITPDEAKVLLAIFQHIGGSPNGPRGLIDGIMVELAKAYAPRVSKYKTIKDASIACKAEGSIYLDKDGK